MGVRGPLAPEKPYSVGVRGAAKPPLPPPLRMESGGRSPPDLPTLVVILTYYHCPSAGDTTSSTSTCDFEAACSCSAKNQVASIAALQPSPAAVIAWR